jgi:hypothetical protein
MARVFRVSRFRSLADLQDRSFRMRRRGEKPLLKFGRGREQKGFSAGNTSSNHRPGLEEGRVLFFDFICQRSSTTPIPAHCFYIGRALVKTGPALSGQPLVLDGRLGAFRKAGSRSQIILSCCASATRRGWRGGLIGSAAMVGCYPESQNHSLGRAGGRMEHFAGNVILPSCWHVGVDFICLQQMSSGDIWYDIWTSSGGRFVR